MSRPARLKIFGKTFRVNYVPGDHPALKQEDLAGALDSQEQQIYVLDGQPLDNEQDILLHEVMHAVEQSMDLDLEETVIQRMATGLLAVIKDNPKFLSYLRRKAQNEIPQTA